MTTKLFSIDLKLDSKTQDTLNRISKSLETIAKNIPANAELKASDLPQDEPTELSMCIPEDLIERPAKKKSWSKYGEDGWHIVPGSQLLKWKLDGDNIRLRYHASYASITWSEVIRISKVPKARRRLEIQKALDTTTLDSVTAVNVFISGYIKGYVSSPDEKNESAKVEEDPDAVYKPMVTPHISTRPDENCGSIESYQGAY